MRYQNLKFKDKTYPRQQRKLRQRNRRILNGAEAVTQSEQDDAGYLSVRFELYQLS